MIAGASAEPEQPGMGGRLPAEFAVSRGTVASSWRLLYPHPSLPPSHGWQPAVLLEAGAIRRPPPLSLSLLLRPLEGNHLPFWNPPPTKPSYFSQLGLKCLQQYRGKADSEEGEEGREGGKKRKEEAAQTDGGTPAFSSLVSVPVCVSLAQTEIGLKCFIMAGLC